jgi:hypothetical protein
MASYNFIRLKRLTIINNVVQVGLLGLLLFMTYNFLIVFARYGMQDAIFRSIGFAVCIQLVMMFPAWWLSKRDVEIEIESALAEITPDQQLALRRRRMLGDIWKISALGAFVVFIFMMPSVDKGRGASVILSIAYFAFLLVSLTYFQCFNFIAKKRRKELS